MIIIIIEKVRLIVRNNNTFYNELRAQMIFIFNHAENIQVMGTADEIMDVNDYSSSAVIYITVYRCYRY